MLIFISAGCDASNGISITTGKAFLLITSLIGGLGLFLMGIKMISDNLTKSTGSQISDWLAKITNNRLSAFVTGIVTTMVLQSSSATSVMLINFVNSRILKFSRSVAVIFGAAIGATVTIQLIAFRFTDYALTIIAVGFITYVLSKRQGIRDIGMTIIGFGILFLGMNLMSESIEPLKHSERLTALIMQLEHPLAGILIGAVITALIQSTSAFMGILIVLANQGLMSLNAAVPLLIGANIGTAVTAIIAAMGTSRESKQVALAHTLFKVTGAFVVIWFIPVLVDVVEKISPGDHAIPRQIANAHTVFNAFIAFLFLPFTNTFGRLVQRIIPVRDEKHTAPSTWYIEESMINSPSFALSLARQEVLRMMEIAQRMTEDIITPFMDRSCHVLEKVREREKEMNFLRDAIHKYLIKIIRQNITSGQVKEAYQMMYIVDEFEQIGDVLSVTLLNKAEIWCKGDTHFSEEGKKELLDFHAKTMKLLYQAYATFNESDKKGIVRDARKFKASYKHFRQEFFDLEKQHYNRLKMDVEDSVVSSRTHMEIIGSFKVIGSHATNIARIILKEEKNGGESPNRGELEGNSEGGI